MFSFPCTMSSSDHSSCEGMERLHCNARKTVRMLCSAAARLRGDVETPERKSVHLSRRCSRQTSSVPS